MAAKGITEFNYALEHEQVFAEAQRIYEKRSQTRGQMWLETTITRELEMIREKLRRAELAFKNGSNHSDKMTAEFEDSLLDLMNFANFAVKKHRRSRT
jgi:hypothetical protein